MVVRWLARGLEQVPDGDAWYSPAEADRAARMPYAKRRTEFRVSRWAAKLAIARALGWSVDESGATPADLAALATIEIRRRPTGAPAPFVAGRPAALMISQTDRADWAVCVVSDGTTRSVGCDLELVEPRSAGFVRAYFTVTEQQAVAAADDADHDLLANLLWSAKESALKVLETGLRRDTRSVEVALHEDTSDGWHRLEVRPEEGGCFPGWWRRSGVFLLSVAASHELPPPVSFEQPDALATAVPTHRWMHLPHG